MGTSPTSVSAGSVPTLPLSLIGSGWLHPESPRFPQVDTSQPKAPQLSGNFRSVFALVTRAEDFKVALMRPWACLPTHPGPAQGGWGGAEGGAGRGWGGVIPSLFAQLCF